MRLPLNGPTKQSASTVINDSENKFTDVKVNKRKSKKVRNGRSIQKTKTKEKTPINPKKYTPAKKNKLVSLVGDKTICRLNKVTTSVKAMTETQKKLLAEHDRLVTELKKFQLADDAKSTITTLCNTVNNKRNSSSKKTCKAYRKAIKKMNLHKEFYIKVHIIPDNKWISLIPPGAGLSTIKNLKHTIGTSMDMLNHYMNMKFPAFESSQQINKINTVIKKLEMKSSNSNMVKEEKNRHENKNITISINNSFHDTDKRCPAARHPVAKLTVSNTQPDSNKNTKDNKLYTPQPLPPHQNVEATKNITIPKKGHTLTNLSETPTNKARKQPVAPRIRQEKSKGNKGNFHKQNTITDLPPVTKRAPAIYHIEVNKRPGKEKIKITVPVAHVFDLKLTKDNMSEIFRRANDVTMNKKYPIQNTSRKFNGVMVHRPNHNGTHSLRKVAHVQNIFSYIKARGSVSAKSLLTNLTESEKNNLLAAAYFMRSGRVDESSHGSPHPDNYKKRSAMIYEAYAQQLGETQEIIDWTKQLITNSCMPSTARDSAIDSDPKSLLGCEILSTAHNLDLVRCYSKRSMDSSISSIKESVSYLSSDYSDNNDHMKLIDYSKNLCEATGSGRVYDNHPVNASLFAKSSVESNYCWDQIQKVQVPVWG